MCPPSCADAPGALPPLSALLFFFSPFVRLLSPLPLCSLQPLVVSLLQSLYPWCAGQPAPAPSLSLLLHIALFSQRHLKRVMATQGHRVAQHKYREASATSQMWVKRVRESPAVQRAGKGWQGASYNMAFYLCLRCETLHKSACLAHSTLRARRAGGKACSPERRLQCISRGAKALARTFVVEDWCARGARGGAMECGMAGALCCNAALPLYVSWPSLMGTMREGRASRHRAAACWPAQRRLPAQTRASTAAM